MGVRRGMVEDLSVTLNSYETHVTEGLDDDDHYDTEALLALVDRDGIHERYDKLTPEERRLLERLDAILISKRLRVSEVLPAPQSGDPDRWWWDLHKGTPSKVSASRRAG